MELVYGVLFLAVGVIGIMVSLLGSRNPQRPRWASDFVVGSVILPLVIGALVMGVSFLIMAILNLDQLSLGFRELMAMAGIIAATLVACKTMRIKKRLAEYAASADMRA